MDPQWSTCKVIKLNSRSFRKRYQLVFAIDVVLHAYMFTNIRNPPIFRNQLTLKQTFIAHNCELERNIFTNLSFIDEAMFARQSFQHNRTSTNLCRPSVREGAAKHSTTGTKI